MSDENAGAKIGAAAGGTVGAGLTLVVCVPLAITTGPLIIGLIMASSLAAISGGIGAAAGGAAGSVIDTLRK